MALKTNDNGIDREMTTDEETAFEASQKLAQAEAEARADEEAERQIARTALLARLGITESEAKLLLG